MAAERVDVAIVGAGMAGAAAAEVLARHGARVLVLDENPHPGGQYLRGGRPAGIGWMDSVRRRGLAMIDRLAERKVEVRSRSEVLGIEGGFELLVADEDRGLCAVKSERVLLATGGRERFMPFKGWTLPGVLATGAVQILVKQSGILPARETVVAGAGLFLAAVARDIQKSGGRVPLVLDEVPVARRLPPPALIARHFPSFLQGGALLARLRLQRTAFRHSTRVLEARGADGPAEVVAARIDPAGAVIPGSETVFPAGCLAVGFGFAANIEAAQLAGCGLAYDSSLGGWVVRVDEELETTVEGIHAAGEITAVGGAAKSLIEGRLAGYSILGRMGLLKPDELAEPISALKMMRRRQMAFARYFNSQYAFPPGYLARWLHGLPDDTVVCRCEDVRLGEVRRAVADGFDTAAGVKKATRCGMGICQGSTCKSILLEVLAALTGKPHSHILPPSVRTPVKPVYLATLAGEKP